MPEPTPPDANRTPAPAGRRPGPLAVVVLALSVVIVVLFLARIWPGPAGLRVTVIETGRVGTSVEP